MKRFLLVYALGLVMLVSSVSASEEASALVVVDHMERRVEIDRSVEVLISLSPSNTEIVFALGLADLVAGVTSFCNYPAEAAEKQVVGGFSDPNLELILTLRPDLVLATNVHQEVVHRLEERGIPTLVVDPKSVDETYDAIVMIGRAAGVPERAEALVEDMQQKIGAVQERLAGITQEERVTVYYELWYDPIMSIGSQSFIHQLIAFAGGDNIFGDIEDAYPMVSSEVVAERNPQVILYPDDHGSAALIQDQFQGRPGWSRVAALENGRIHGLDSDQVNRSGPRLVRAIEDVAALLYPQLFE